LPKSPISSAEVTYADGSGLSVSSFTRTVPDCMIPIAFAASTERSMILPLTNGPRSLMRTTTSLSLFRLVTLTHVPNGRVGCAAVSLCILKVSPFAVFFPLGCFSRVEEWVEVLGYA
jgi:hypothetical protein